MKYLFFKVIFGIFCFSGLLLQDVNSGTCNTWLEKLSLSANEINHRVYGDGKSKPTLVMIHGLDSALQTFIRPVTEPLSEDYQILVFDQRGHGKTVDKGQNYSNEILADDLAVLLDSLGIEKVALLGHSLGGKTAVKFSAKYRHRVSHLIIEDIGLNQKIEADKIDEIAARAAQWKAMFPENLIFESRDQAAQAIESRYKAQTESILQRRGRDLEDGKYQLFFRPWISLLYGSQAHAENLLPDLENISGLGIPILLIRPQDFEQAAISEDEELALLRAASNARVVEIEDATHNVHGSTPEYFVQAVQEFLRK